MDNEIGMSAIDFLKIMDSHPCDESNCEQLILNKVKLPSSQEKYIKSLVAKGVLNHEDGVITCADIIKYGPLWLVSMPATLYARPFSSRIIVITKDKDFGTMLKKLNGTESRQGAVSYNKKIHVHNSGAIEEIVIVKGRRHKIKHNEYGDMYLFGDLGLSSEVVSGDTSQIHNKISLIAQICLYFDIYMENIFSKPRTASLLS